MANLNAARARVLADKLLAASIDETVTYSQLGAAIGERQAPFYLIHKALSMANAEQGAIFANVRRVGYKRLPGRLVHVLQRSDRERTRRVQIRSIRRATNCVLKNNDIPPEDLRKIYAEQAQAGLMQHMTYDRNMPIIKEGSPPPPNAATVQATMEALLRHRQAEA